MALSEFPRLGFDPFAELRRMQSEMNRVFSGFNATAARDFPPINIWLGLSCQRRRPQRRER
jgi:hypothetical protein